MAARRKVSVPQVLMMMNGKAQEMLTNKDSLIFRTMDKVKLPRGQGGSHLPEHPEPPPDAA